MVLSPDDPTAKAKRKAARVKSRRPPRPRLPGLARQVLQVLAVQIEQIDAAVTALEKQLMACHKTNPVSQRLATIPGIGPIIATAIAAIVAAPNGFRSGREFAAWPSASIIGPPAPAGPPAKPQKNGVRSLFATKRVDAFVPKIVVAAPPSWFRSFGRGLWNNTFAYEWP
jgi:hypothetical protein